MRDPLGFLSLSIKLPLAFAAMAFTSVATSLWMRTDGSPEAPWLVGIVTVAVMATLVLVITRFMLRPLGELVQAARRIQRGHAAPELHIEQSDEIGELADAFRSMSRTIRDRETLLEKATAGHERQRIEAERERDRLEHVMAAMDYGLFIIGRDGHSPIANAAGRSFQHMLFEAGDDPEPRACPLPGVPDGGCRACLRTSSRSGRCRIRVQQRTLELSVQSLVSVRYGPPEHLVVCRDISERVAAEERHVQQERMHVVGAMAAVIANDLNNPLAAISMFAGLLADRFADDPQVCADLAVIQRNADAGGQAIRLLIEATVTEPSARARFTVGELLAGAARFAEPLARASGVVLAVEVSPEAAERSLEGDRQQLQQAIANLVLNSVEAIETASRGQSVRLTAGCVPGHSKGQRVVEIRVIDDGPGIPPDLRDQDLLFRPFFTTHPGRGTGLGLSTARQIVQTHDGQLMLVESRSGYTEFLLTFHGTRAASSSPPEDSRR